MISQTTDKLEKKPRQTKGSRQVGRDLMLPGEDASSAMTKRGEHMNLKKAMQESTMRPVTAKECPSDILYMKEGRRLREAK